MGEETAVTAHRSYRKRRGNSISVATVWALSALRKVNVSDLAKQFIKKLPLSDGWTNNSRLIAHSGAFLTVNQAQGS